MNQAYREFDIKYDIRLNEIRDEVIAAIKSMSAPNAKVLGIHGNQLGILNSKLVGLKKELDVCDTQAEVIKSLYFKEIKRRWSVIPEAEEKTNSWLFDRSKTNFASWAESKEVSAIYCISGLVSSQRSED